MSTSKLNQLNHFNFELPLKCNLLSFSGSSVLAINSFLNYVFPCVRFSYTTRN